MIDKRHVLDVRERVKGFAHPVLSLYATINGAVPDINPKAVSIRVKNALKRHANVPEDIANRVLAAFNGTRPPSRSVAVFADKDHIEVLPFEVPLVNDVENDEVDLHFGEAYFTPLLVALDQHEPYLVAHADRNRLRLFRVYMGQITEELRDVRSKVADEQDDIQPSPSSLTAGVADGSPANTNSGSTASIAKNGPSFVADRGDAADQLMQESVKHSQSLFYKEHGRIIAKMMQEGAIRRLVIMGPERDTHMLKAELPNPVGESVVAVLPSMPNPDASAAEVLARITPKIAEVELEKEAELIDQIRERGVWGLDQCLKALQEGRLHTVAVPGRLHQDVYVEEGSRYITLDENTAHDLGEHIAKIDLAEKLPELAAAGGARLEFVHGDVERRLIEEFGGMAGLRRW